MSKTLAVGEKQRIAHLLKEAIEHHQRCAVARLEAAGKQDEAIYEAWQAGVRLNKIKPEIGHGNWLPWLDLNFCKRATVVPRMAQLYMKIDNDNPNARRVAHLKFDTIRKYRIGFVPEKEKPLLGNNVTFPRITHHLKLVNDFNRWKRRRDTGQIESDREEERRDFQEIFDWMRSELYATGAA